MAVVLVITLKSGEIIEMPVFESCVVGRSSKADCQVEDKQMSGRHGIFELNQEGVLFYKDLESTNGSYLNNSKIHNVKFRVNELLKLGNTTIHIDEKKLNLRELKTIGKAADCLGKDALSVSNIKIDKSEEDHESSISSPKQKSIILKREKITSDSSLSKRGRQAKKQDSDLSLKLTLDKSKIKKR